MHVSQTRKMSMVEVAVSTAIGYAVALATQMVVFPMLGIAVTVIENVWIGVIFTAVSLARGYAVRRLFNYLHTR